MYISQTMANRLLKEASIPKPRHANNWGADVVEHQFPYTTFYVVSKKLKAESGIIIISYNVPLTTQASAALRVIAKRAIRRRLAGFGGSVVALVFFSRDAAKSGGGLSPPFMRL